ncbi:MAG: hypothetical protein L0387_21420 [Acidobacteria bacterium]|nr:hypothetical protein [Acidobacteriota bacterium]
MTHLTEKQLVALRYGEVEAGSGVEQHLTACEDCRRSFERLQSVLAAVEAMPVPTRDASYGRRVWQQIAPRLDERERPVWRNWFSAKRLTLAAAMAVLVLAAFVAGRFWPRPPEPPTATSIPPEVRERILLVAVGEHLDRSQMVLVELVNANPPAAGEVDISGEQRRARELVTANRLYRQTAEQAGEAAVASVLDELERVLVEIANSPTEVPAVQLAQLQKRIEAKGILFKVRVIGSEVRGREQPKASTNARSDS